MKNGSTEFFFISWFIKTLVLHTIENFPLIGDAVDEDGYIDQYLIRTIDKNNNCPNLDKDPTICLVNKEREF